MHNLGDPKNTSPSPDNSISPLTRNRGSTPLGGRQYKTCESTMTSTIPVTIGVLTHSYTHTNYCTRNNV
jgi:hypothetical protein